MNYLETLQRLNACHGPSGDERDVAALLKELGAPYVDDCRSDVMGNLILHKKGSGPRVMFAAHMDSLGLIVTHIEENGFLRFGKIGGIQPTSLLHTPVRFKNGVYGVVSLSEKVEKKDASLTDFYLDIGAKSREEAKEKVQIGDTAVVCTPAFSLGERMASPYMDNRISCLVLLDALSQLGDHENDLYFVFTVQEELGMRGAKTAAFAIDPDYGIAVDVTLGDELDSTHRGSSVLGGGAAIKVMDQSVICHPQVVEDLETLARKEGIPHQRDVITGGGTDAGAIHVTRMGVLTGGICIPCRYIHSPVETVDLKDVEACAALVKAFAEATLPRLG